MSPKGNYLTSYSGEVDLKDIKNPEALEKVAKLVTEHFSGFMNLNKTEKVLYISGDFDNTDGSVEKFFYWLTKKLHFAWTEIKAQGQDPKDKYDIILSRNQLFIQEYFFQQGSLKEYISK